MYLFTYNGTCQISRSKVTELWLKVLFVIHNLSKEYSVVIRYGKNYVSSEHKYILEN